MRRALALAASLALAGCARAPSHPSPWILQFRSAGAGLLGYGTRSVSVDQAGRLDWHDAYTLTSHRVCFGDDNAGLGFKDRGVMERAVRRLERRDMDNGRYATDTPLKSLAVLRLRGDTTRTTGYVQFYAERDLDPALRDALRVMGRFHCTPRPAARRAPR